MRSTYFRVWERKVPGDMQKDSVESPLETRDHKFRVAAEKTCYFSSAWQVGEKLFCQEVPGTR